LRVDDRATTSSRGVEQPHLCLDIWHRVRR